MKVQFVGVGEAFDEYIPNNSQILQWHGARLLIDCGYAVPHALWKLHPDADYIDAVYLSHRHADHYFGLPSYLLRLAEEKRKREIIVLCPEGMKQLIYDVIEYAYQSILPRLGFDVVIQEVYADRPFAFRDAELTFAVSSHPVKNFAIAVSAEGKKYGYSGDGNFNEHTRKLYHRCSLLVHECYSYDQDVRGHAKAIELLPMVKDEKVQRLALTHLQRDVRRKQRRELEQLISNVGVNAFIPEAGDECEV